MEATVNAAEATLAQAQIDLEATRTDLGRLTRLHHTQLGTLYDRLDELDLQIAEAEAAVSNDPDLIRRAYELRYGNGADTDSYFASNPDFDPLTDPLPPPPPPPAPAAALDPDYASTLRFTEPTGEEQPAAANPAKAAQRLYRELARKVHPDLAQDPVEKERRNAFIARVNDAYRRVDLYELQRLAEEWAVLSSSGPEPDSEQRELWLRQRLIWLRARTAEARVEQETLLSSPLGRVLAEYGADDALRALADQLWDQIRGKEEQLQAILLNGSAASSGSASADAASPDAVPVDAVTAHSVSSDRMAPAAGRTSAHPEPNNVIVESFDRDELAETVVTPSTGFWG